MRRGVGWFNEERLHSDLDDPTPAEAEAALARRDLVEAA